jgi:hypothetical protein
LSAGFEVGDALFEFGVFVDDFLYFFEVLFSAAEQHDFLFEGVVFHAIDIVEIIPQFGELLAGAGGDDLSLVPPDHGFGEGRL